MTTLISLLCLVVAVVGCILALGSLTIVRRFDRDVAAAVEVQACSVTVLKPLHGAEPGLFENLVSFLEQDYDGAVQVIFGVTSASDPAVAVVRRIMTDYPGRDIELVVGSQAYASNGKVANLMGMGARIRHELIVLSDSDMRVDRHYLARVASALSQPGVGLVTCLYRGDPAAGLWSLLSSMAIDYHFFPSVLLGVHLKKARPCMGATMAFAGTTLDAIGGFGAFASCLADDYAIGEAVRATGQHVIVDRQLIAHRCTERSLTDLFQHELRWARTLRTIDPAGFAGSFITNPLPFALLAAMLRGFDLPGVSVLALTVLCRLALQRQIEKTLRIATSRWLLSPVRDVLSIVVFCASFLVTDVVWRGNRYRVSADGTMKDLKGSRP